MQQVVKTAIPVAGSMLSGLFMMMVDRITLARYSPETLAASGPAIFTAMTAIMLFTGLVSMTRTFVGQANGQGSPRRVAAAAYAGLVVAVLAGVVLIALSPLLTRIPGWTGVEPSIAALQRDYLAIAPWFGAVMLVNTAFTCVFNGVLQTRTTMVVSAAGNVVNAGLTVALVYGWGIFPELGMRGSAYATLLASLSSAAFYAVLLARRGLLAAMPLAAWTAEVPPLARRLLRVGAPAGVTAALEEGGQTMFVWLVGSLSALAMMANNVAVSVNYIAIIPIIGVGVGCSILVANRIGAKDEAGVTRTIKAALAVAGAYVVAMVSLQLAAPDLLARLFIGSDATPELVEATRAAIRVLWTFASSFLFSMILGGVLEAKGMTKSVLFVRLVLIWGGSVPALWWISRAHAGSDGYVTLCWILGSVFEVAIAITYAGIYARSRAVSGDVFRSTKATDESRSAAQA
jgi:MATE family multidrug resistance protein